MECNYCKKSLKTLSSLNYHKKNNKKCLEIQKNNFDNINSILTLCLFCNKQFTNIKTHSCKIKKLKEEENINSTNNKSQILINELKSIIDRDNLKAY